MEIRCARCGHLGAAAEIIPTGEGVALRCAHCSFDNPLALGFAQRQPQAVAAAASPQLAAQLRLGGAQASLAPEALARLIPIAGDGPRCRKCAHLLEVQDESCAKCGLSAAEGARYAPGQAPWEQPAPGQEQTLATLNALWAQALRAWSAPKLEAFTAHALDQNLHDHALRLVRFALITRPEDPLALQALAKLTATMQTRVVAARAQAEVSAANLKEDLQRVRRTLIFGIFIFWAFVLGLFVIMFARAC